MTLIIFCGAISSAFSAATISLTKIIGDLIYESDTKSSSFQTEVFYFIHEILDQIFFFIDVRPIYSLIAILYLSFLMANIMRYIFVFNIRNLAEIKSVSMRERLMSHYLNLDAKFKNSMNQGSGGLISRMLNDVQIYQQGMTKLPDLIKAPFLVLFSALWLFLLNWKLSLFLFLGFPPIIYVVHRLSKSLRKHSKKNQETMEGLTMALKEGLDGARLIHSFDLQNQMEGRFKKQINRYLSGIRRVISREELSGPLIESIFSIVICANLLLIYFIAQDGGLTFGDFIGILAAIGYMLDSARKTQNAFIRIQQASVAKLRTEDIFSNASLNKANEPIKDKNFPKVLSEIEFENVVVDIDDKRILNQVNLNIKSGQKIALVGSSGSGKTTLLNLLDLYIKPTHGKIKFNGIDSQKIDSEDLRSNIALVSQDPFLFNLSIFENLKLIKSDLTEKEAKEFLILANADFIFKRSESIHCLAGERGGNLSGGERQRVSIARALVKDAPILLLDEATSALDTQNEKEVQKGLDSLKKGRTCFVVAHRISTIVDSDLILVFDSGKIVQIGTHQELIRQEGLYTKLCEMQYLI